jgi:hypothetical protein
MITSLKTVLDEVLESLLKVNKSKNIKELEFCPDCDLELIPNGSGCRICMGCGETFGGCLD